MKTYTCPICQKTYDDPNAFNGHKAGHNKQAMTMKINKGAKKFQEEQYETRILQYDISPKRCKHCDAKLDYNKRKHTFCSSSCSASFNATIRRKSKIHISKPTKIDYWNNKTIGDLLGTGANRYNKIRQHARRISDTQNQKCSKCNYDKHIEVCHIKPIKDFDINTPILTVNAISNLLLLCPNCHWEHDNLKGK
jgi:predicted HNH restriction endonuclease